MIAVSENSLFQFPSNYVSFNLILQVLIKFFHIPASLRTADAFPVVASLPPKNSYIPADFY